MIRRLLSSNLCHKRNPFLFIRMSSQSSTIPQPPLRRSDAVLNYWFGEDRENPTENFQLWYGGAPETDAYICTNFQLDIDAAEAGQLSDWINDKYSALALVILLDQFALNAYRDQAKGFEVSALAIPAAYAAVEKGYDKALPKPMASFLFMPLMHSEKLPDQEKCVELFQALNGEPSEFAIEHRDIVKKYGRFPGRNAAHGRTNTAAEEEYLKNGGVF